jgi:hypothetical protein
MLPKVPIFIYMDRIIHKIEVLKNAPFPFCMSATYWWCYSKYRAFVGWLA